MLRPIEPAPGIPPYIAMLLNEDFWSLTPIQAVRKLRGMLRDLKDQVRASDPIATLPDVGHSASGFSVTLSGALDLFGREGVCPELRCRMQSTTQIARSISLLADRVTLTDYFGEMILGLRRPTNDQLFILVQDILILHLLRPLIEAGLLRFRSPWIPACQSCISFFENRVEALSGQVLEVFRDQIKVVRHGEIVEVDTGPMFDPPVFYTARGAAATKEDEAIVQSLVHKCIRSSMWDARDAGFTHGAVFSNSRIGLAGILAEEGRMFGGGRGVTAFEGHRAAQLPFVSGLNIQQVLQLREEAHEALPALRAFLASRLCASESQAGSATSVPDYVSELQVQAVDVRTELKLATSRSSSLARNTIGILSLGVCAYGLAMEGMGRAAGAAQLLTTLGLLHQMNGPDHTQIDRLRAKPGYVLVAAEALLSHAH